MTFFLILEEPTTTIEPTTEQPTTGNRNIQDSRNVLPFSVSAIYKYNVEIGYFWGGIQI